MGGFFSKPKAPKPKPLPSPEALPDPGEAGKKAVKQTRGKRGREGTFQVGDLTPTEEYLGRKKLLGE